MNTASMTNINNTLQKMKPTLHPRSESIVKKENENSTNAKIISKQRKTLKIKS